MENRVFERVANELSEGYVILDEHLTVQFWNLWMARASGVNSEDAIGKTLVQIFGSKHVSRRLLASCTQALERCTSRVLSRAFNQVPLPLASLQSERELMVQSISIRSMHLDAGERYCSLEIRDHTLEYSREKHLESLNRQLAQSVREANAFGERVSQDLVRTRQEKEVAKAQRLESIGQLAAGIAHEINTPTQYIGDNTRFLQESFDELIPLIEMANKLATAVSEGLNSTELASDLNSAFELADLEFLGEEIPHAIGQSLDGIAHVGNIVSAMKEFAHPGKEEMSVIDLNHTIQSAVTIATSEWKYVADMEFDLDPELPAVTCWPGEFNQVILNIVINAAHAVADVVKEDAAGGKGKISVSTRRDGKSVEVRISDTGTGIPKNIRKRIFEPFFTSKEVGVGTGQGLAIAHSVIVLKHGGTLDLETEMGKGTTFIIRMPLREPTLHKVK